MRKLKISKVVPTRMMKQAKDNQQESQKPYFEVSKYLKDKKFNEIGRLHFQELLNNSLNLPYDKKRDILHQLSTANEEKVLKLYENLIKEKELNEKMEQETPDEIQKMLNQKIDDHEVNEAKWQIVEGRKNLYRLLNLKEYPEPQRNVLDLVEAVLANK